MVILSEIKKSKFILLIFILFAFSIKASNKVDNNSTKKNIIFILSDDHRYDAMSFMGKYDFLKTPNMDMLAKKGAHFQNAFVSTSLCSPSRASILTGQYVHKHGVVDNQSPVKETLTYFPQYMQKMGYETAFIGKWHMGENQGNDNPRKGFDKWISFKGQGEYFDPVLNIDGKRSVHKGYITDILTDLAIEWMNKKRDKPFFLYLSHKAVHAMFEPAEQDSGKYDNVKIVYPDNMANTKENYKGKPRWVKEQRNSWHGVDYMYYNELKFDDFLKRYCETLISLDRSIGKIVKFTKDKGIENNTVLLYMGDNGFVFGEHGLIDKRHMYEESIRVPLLAYAPGMIKPGSKIPQLVQNIDIAPTILDIAKIEKPKNMDGHSFLPIMKGENIPWDYDLYYEYYWERAFPQTPTTFGVRTSKYKYIYYYGVWDTEELYDIQSDPTEMNNLIDNPKYKNVVDKLNNKMFNWLETTNGMQIPLKRIPEFIRDEHGPTK